MTPADFAAELANVLRHLPRCTTVDLAEWAVAFLEGRARSLLDMGIDLPKTRGYVFCTYGRLHTANCQIVDRQISDFFHLIPDGLRCPCSAKVVAC